MSKRDIGQEILEDILKIKAHKVGNKVLHTRNLMTLDEYFNGNDESRKLFEILRGLVESFGHAEIRVTKSQIAFYRRKAFAWAWIPGNYLHGRGAPLVLTLSFHRRDTSPRWKENVEPAPGRFTHHLELYSARDIDNEVHDWLHEAWLKAA